MAIARKSKFDGQTGFTDATRLSGNRVSLTFAEQRVALAGVWEIADGQLTRRMSNRESLRLGQLVITGKTKAILLGSKGLVKAGSPLTDFLQAEVGVTLEPVKLRSPSAAGLQVAAIRRLEFSIRDEEELPPELASFAGASRVVVAGENIRGPTKRALSKAKRAAYVVSILGREIAVRADYGRGTLTLFNKRREPLSFPEALSFLERFYDQGGKADG